MKIGLEFEGVIVDYKSCQITRWSQIPQETRDAIKKIIYYRREKEEPIDNYDCLAEVRTPPLLNPTPIQLIEALYSEMELASKAFAINGFEIRWYEQPIPEDLHEQIQRYLSAAEINPPNNEWWRYKKETHTLTTEGVELYKSEGNRFRGGGLHINISPLPSVFAPSVVVGLNHILRHARLHYKFQSHYRNNVLFRTRYDNSDRDYKEPIIEYMSHGFNVPVIDDWRETLEIRSKKDQWYRVGHKNWAKYSGMDFNHMDWAWDVCRFMNEFFKAIEKTAET